MNDAHQQPLQASGATAPEGMPSRGGTSRRSVLHAGLTIGAAGLLAPALAPTRAFASEGAQPAAAPFLTPPEPTPELIYQTSFEDSSDSSWLTQATSFDTAQQYSGLASLKYTRTDATSYVFTGPHIAGATSRYDEISASVWVKTAGITDGGASFCVEWYTADDCYLSGNYTNSTSSTEWTQLTLAPFAVPIDAAYMKVIFFLGRDHAGTAWYDDLAVFRSAPRLLRAKLATPSYRGLLIPGESEDIDLRVQLFAPDDTPHDYRVRVELLDANGGQVNVRTLAGQQDLRYTYSSSNLAYGDYTLRVSALASAGSVVGRQETLSLKKLRSSEVPASYIDSHGRLRRNGELFFPLTAYNYSPTTQNLDDLAYASFNSLISYGAPTQAQMDLTQAKGLSVAYIHQNTDVSTVQQFKNHPALLAWYINDEGDLSTRPAELRARYESVLNNDPDHPAYSVDYRVWPGGDEEYVTDAYGTDGYPIFGLPTDRPQRVSRLVGATVEEMPNRMIWPVIQISNQGNYGPGRGVRPPTQVEVRSMCWQAIAKGATGLSFYSYFDLVTDSSGVSPQTLLDQTKAVVSEIRSLVPIILATGRLPNIKTTASDDLLTWTTREADGRRFIFAANTAKESQQLSFGNIHARSVVALAENRTIAAPNNAFQDTLPPLGVGLYELQA
ncbi:hypothetical protein ACFQB0_08590 [Luethyella okanaganae]|uniref:Uncharacterized protein n=2 Tax=Luethyella okanaganae TaxID=69372 RepID=A0ABW1VEG8_9MICO